MAQCHGLADPGHAAHEVLSEQRRAGEQLERRRETLQREYQAADEAMSQLNAQSNSLSSLGGQYRLF